MAILVNTRGAKYSGDEDHKPYIDTPSCFCGGTSALGETEGVGAPSDGVTVTQTTIKS